MTFHTMKLRLNDRSLTTILLHRVFQTIEFKSKFILLTRKLYRIVFYRSSSWRINFENVRKRRFICNNFIHKKTYLWNQSSLSGPVSKKRLNTVDECWKNWFDFPLTSSLIRSDTKWTLSMTIGYSFNQYLLRINVASGTNINFESKNCLFSSSNHEQQNQTDFLLKILEIQWIEFVFADFLELQLCLANKSSTSNDEVETRLDIERISLHRWYRSVRKWFRHMTKEVERIDENSMIEAEFTLNVGNFSSWIFFIEFFLVNCGKSIHSWTTVSSVFNWT